MQQTKCNNNKMLMHGFILVTILATAKSAEAEITMEAAFQGHCGHTSPCEQLCYEIHDGMYECDCIEGYELNKNGYSCQVINSTSTGEGHSKSDEDVLYQKGASFSAKLAGNTNMGAGGSGTGMSMSSFEAMAARAGDEPEGTSISSASTEENDEGGEDADDLVDSFFNQDLTSHQLIQKHHQLQQKQQQQQQQLLQQKQKQHQLKQQQKENEKQEQEQQETVNSQDYYISAESINYSNEQDHDHDPANNSPVVPEYKANAYTEDEDDDESNELVNSQHRISISTAKPSAKLLLSNKQMKQKKLKKNKNISTKLGDIKFKLSLRNGVEVNSKNSKNNAATTVTSTTTTTTVRPAELNLIGDDINDDVVGGAGGGGDDDNDSNVSDDYYVKQELDMSVYDDVNNNQLNLRPLGHQNRYEYEYHQQQQQQQQHKQRKQQAQPQNTYQNVQRQEPEEHGMLITGAAAIAATGGRLPAATSSDNHHYANNNNNNNYNNNNNVANGNIDNEERETAAISATNHEILGISMTMTGASVVGASEMATTATATTATDAIVAAKLSTKITNISAESVQCNLDCGAEGVCERSNETGALGIAHTRCLCPFGKTNNGCIEDIKVRVPKFSKRSWIAFPALRGAYKHVQLRIEFRPESFDGILLLSGERDDLTGDFMALLLNKGFVEFWFDCGSGVGNVRSRETILLNEWNSVIIYRHRWDAWLVLNHGTKVQGRSNGLFSRITFREPVFLGGTGNITGLAKRLPVYNGFVGCIRRFVANEHDYKFDEHPVGDVANGFDIQDCITDKCFKFPCQHGGKCLPSDQGAVCLCPIGYVGDLCEIRMDLQVPAFNGSSFLRYAPLGDSMLIWMELKVIFKPEHPDGLIMYSGPEKKGDFIALALNEGFVEFTFDLGSGPAVVKSEYPITIGQWHTVKVSRTARLAVLKIDQSPEVMTISTNGFWHLSLPENLFVGGVNHVDRLPLDLKYKPFFMGCIQKIDINGHGLAIISEALGGTNIGNCPHACVARPCGPLAECIPQMESYECRCSAYNSQCNKAAEVSLDEISHTKATKSRNKQLGNVNHEPKTKKTGLYHKQIKSHGKGHGHAWPKQLISLSAVVKPDLPSTMATSMTSTTTTTTTTTSRPLALFDDDDIIFRDVHGMHRKYGHQKPSHSTTSGGALTNSKQTQQSKHLGKVQQGNIDGSKKYDAHHKYMAFEPRKLSRLPTHYESFQTDSESDILTFDDNVEVELRLPSISQDRSEEESDEWSFVDTPVIQSHPTTAKTFILDESLFDEGDDTEEYQRKQLAQDMKRIMTNPRKIDTTTTSTTTTATPRTTTNVTPKIVTDDYRDDDPEALYESDEWEDDYSVEDAKLIATGRRSAGKQRIINANIDTSVNDDEDSDDELLSAVRQTMAPSKQQYQGVRTTTPQTHTDWSLLKKLDLSAEQAQSHTIGVRKNFGACFAGKDSYFHYNDAETMSQIISYNIDLNLRIKTHSPDGVILWTGRQGDFGEDDDNVEDDNDDDDGSDENIGDFLSLGIENGYLHFRYDLGSGEVDIRYNVSRVSDGLWHRVRAIRNSQEGYLEVDGRKSLTQHSPGHLRQLNTDTGLYVGGMPELSYFTRRKYNSGIVGCISEIILAGELKLNFDPNTLGTSHNVETGIL